MIAIDKIRQYLRSVSEDEEYYDYLLITSFIDPRYRNKECQHPEHETCETCPLNLFYKHEWKKYHESRYEFYKQNGFKLFWH